MPQDRIEPLSVQADGYSRSALGHRGLIHLLRSEGWHVAQRRSSSFTLSAAGLQVFAEPSVLGSESEDRLYNLIQQAEQALVVLPKRSPKNVVPNEPWLRDTQIDRQRDAQRVLDTVAADVTPALVRQIVSNPTSGWSSPVGLPLPAFATANVQLLAPGGFEPLLTCEAGTLVARVGHVTILSDPDVLANHGLAQNAPLALALFDLISGDRSVAFDETLHGHTVEPSFLAAMGSFPLVLVPVHLLLMLAVALWMAHGRFGPVEPPPTVIAPGKAYLLDNVAALLATRRDAMPSLRRYARQQVRRAALADGASKTMSNRELRVWFLARNHHLRAGRELAETLATIHDSPRQKTAARTLAAQVHALIEELSTAHSSSHSSQHTA